MDTMKADLERMRDIPSDLAKSRPEKSGDCAPKPVKETGIPSVVSGRSPKSTGKNVPNKF